MCLFFRLALVEGRRVERTRKWRNSCLTNSKSRKGGRKSELYNIQVVMMQPAIFILLISSLWMVAQSIHLPVEEFPLSQKRIFVRDQITL